MSDNISIHGSYRHPLKILEQGIWTLTQCEHCLGLKWRWTVVVCERDCCHFQDQFEIVSLLCQVEMNDVGQRSFDVVVDSILVVVDGVDHV